MKTVAIIVPIFNELESIKLFYNRLEVVVSSIKDHNFIICFIDDGSSDKSSEVIKEIIHNIDLVLIFFFTIV